jgi:hypothetical protein
MARYVKTRGKNFIALAICDRCRMKMPYTELRPDGNLPGLQVCGKCCDGLDPYRLPPRQTEDISLPTPRPEEPLT